MTHIRLTALSDDASLALPAAVAAKLGVQPGDELQVVETETGLEIRTVPPSEDDAFETAKQIMEEDEPVLRKLAE